MTRTRNHVTGNASDDRHIQAVVVDNDDETPNHVSCKDHPDLSLAHNDRLACGRLVAHICLHICPDRGLPVAVVAHIYGKFNLQILIHLWMLLIYM